MAKPRDKKLVKKIVGDAEVRAAVTRAILENKAHVVLDGRPCSLEVTKGARGDISWNVKLYVKDSKEMLDSVSDVKAITDQIEKEFSVKENC